MKLSLILINDDMTLLSRDTQPIKFIILSENQKNMNKKHNNIQLHMLH